MRKASLLAAAVLALGLSATAVKAADNVIHVLNWQGYGTDEPWALKMFKEATGITVVHDYFNSEQEMLTKLRTNPGAYDVVLINSAYTGQAAEEGLIQPIDTSKISNFKDLTPSLRNSPYFKYKGKLYGVSWLWGLTSIAYNDKKITKPGDSIEILWDPKYKNDVAVRDDAIENVYLAALATGQDMNDPKNLDAIVAKLKALKPQIRTLWSSEDEWNKDFAAGLFDVSVYWSGSASRSKKHFHLPVGYLIPKEGAIAWLDGLSIAANAPNPEGAAKFINFMIDPAFYVKWDTDVGAPASANAVAMSKLPADAFNRRVLGAPGVTERLQYMGPLPDARRQKFLEIWDEVKSYYAE